MSIEVLQQQTVRLRKVLGRIRIDGRIRVKQIVLVVGKRIEVVQGTARERVSRWVARWEAVQVAAVVAGIAEKMIEIVCIAVCGIADRTGDRAGQSASE